MLIDMHFMHVYKHYVPCDLSVSGLLVMRCWQVWLCLPVASIDLEEAEAPSAVMCNMSHSPGHSQVIQYHFLSSPCANRQGLRGTISGKVGEGDILFSNYRWGQAAGFKGKTNEVGLGASC